jgi:ABC-type glycerol-3-phosphate transport system substrate-binding protein
LISVVSKSAKHPEICWEFLIDLTSPDRGSLELISAGTWGAGVSRGTHLEPKARPRWFGYGLKADETLHLVDALRDNLGNGIQNGRTPLRTPNQAELTKVLAESLREMLDGKRVPSDAMKHAANRWKEIVRPLGERWPQVYRKSLGL